ncbi:MAG: aldolase/citrate lyase family protein [Chloroflexota bacterium]|nr:aldolase/citrate lyase family protein [Chloroflexota bacterium]
MRPNKVKQYWQEKKPLAMGWLGSPDTYIVETMANSGFDALVLDMQHGMGIGPDRAVIALQAISTTDVTPLVRVPWNDPIYIQYVLDAGAYGVIVPMVNSRAEAEKAAGATKYAPLGYRSNGANRARFYAGSDYFAHANSEILCFVMIETTQAIENLEEIATTPGVDGFYIGPSDLAITMGLEPKLDHDAPRHVEAVQKVVDAAKKHGLQAGIHTTGPEEVLRRYQQGFNLCPLGSDAGFVGAGARKAVADLRGAAPAAASGSPYA